MIRFLSTSLLVLSTLLFACSCDRRTKNDLDVIEGMLNSRPDSALFLIERINTRDIKTENNRARHSLLLSMALDKNYIDITSDSIIRKAVDYYSFHSLCPNRMKTWYYEGRIQVNCGNYSSAIIALEKAESDALLLDDHYYLGLIYREKASIYNTWNNIPAATKYNQKAYSSFLLSGKDSHASYCLLSIGIALFNEKKYDEARYYLNKAKQETNVPGLLNHCNLRLADISVEKHENPDSSLSIFQSIPKHLFDLYDYGYQAIAWEQSGRRDSSSVWMNLGYSNARSKVDSASLDYMYSGIYFDRGDYQKAYALIKNVIDVQDDYTRSILQESLNTALKDYYREELALQEEKNAREKERRLWMGILFGLGMILMAGFFIWRLKSKDQILELQLAQYAVVQKENRSIQQDNAHLIGSLFSERLRQMDKLSDEYYAADEKRKKELVFDAFKSYLEEFRRDKDAFKSLEEFLNRYADGIMEKLDKQVPRISGEKRKIVSMFFAGLSYEAIQLITKSVSIESLRMLRSRIRKEIKESGAPDAELFLSMMETKKVADRQTKTNE